MRLQWSIESTRDRRGQPDDDAAPERENAAASPEAPIIHRPRSALARRLFPPTVRLPGTGDVVLVNAVGRPIADVLAKAQAFGDRWIVATDDPDVGALREAEITYEYLPADLEGGLAGRIRWFDYVYGMDSIVDIDEVRTGPTSGHRTTERPPS